MLPPALRSLPYLVHTDRELGLMLRGSKPLSIFSYTEGHEVDCVIRYLRMFDRTRFDGCGERSISSCLGGSRT